MTSGLGTGKSITFFYSANDGCRVTHSVVERKMKRVQLSSTPWCRQPSHSWPPTWWTLLPRTVCRSLVCADQPQQLYSVIIMLWSLPKVKVKCWWTNDVSWHDCSAQYWNGGVFSLMAWCSMYSKILTKCRTETLYMMHLTLDMMQYFYSQHDAILKLLTWCSTPIPWHDAILSLVTWCSILIPWRNNTLALDTM